MKILVLTPYCYPEHAASSYLGQNRNQAFVENGFEMLTYAPTPCRGVNNEIRKKYCRKEFKREVLNNGQREIRRFSMYPESKNAFLRALRYFFVACKHFYYGLSEDARKCNLMFIASTPPFQGALAGIIKKITHQPLVYNLQDIFPDSLAGTGLAKKGGLLWKIGRVIEDFTYRNADKIIVISEDFKRNIMEKGVPEDKIVVIYNWVDEEAVKPVKDSDNGLFEELGINRDNFNVVYAGNLGNAQNVRILIETALLLQEYSDIQFVIFGTGGQEQEYKKLVESMALQNVSFYPIQPYEKVSKVYGIGDVCVVSCKEGLGGSAMPSKTWSIMASGRAVLANFDEGDLKSILETNHCGVFTKAGDKVAFKQAILDLYHDREHCEQLGRNGREFILKNLTRAVGTQKYVDVIKAFEKTKD